jgi:hypothetical protein
MLLVRNISFVSVLEFADVGAKDRDDTVHGLVFPANSAAAITGIIPETRT